MSQAVFSASLLSESELTQYCLYEEEETTNDIILPPKDSGEVSNDKRTIFNSARSGHADW
jgi:hypothetical protein